MHTIITINKEPFLIKENFIKSLLTALVVLFFFLQVNAQHTWFSTYYDSTAIVQDANTIIQEITDRIEANNSCIILQKNTAIKNTTPNLIFINYKDHTVALPLWIEVIPQQKQFFAEILDGQQDGKDIFGLFFNGFYLAHELGHSFFLDAGIKFDNNYDSEYDANTFAILYWKTVGKSENLEKCYNYAKEALKTLKNPVPKNKDYKRYITKNYNTLAANPYQYGFIQFSQFIEIYDNKNLPDFDSYIKKCLQKQ